MNPSLTLSTTVTVQTTLKDMSLLPSVLLQVCSTSNNANGNKMREFFWYRLVLWWWWFHYTNLWFHCTFRDSE